MNCDRAEEVLLRFLEAFRLRLSRVASWKDCSSSGSKSGIGSSIRNDSVSSGGGGSRSGSGGGGDNDGGGGSNSRRHRHRNHHHRQEKKIDYLS